MSDSNSKRPLMDISGQIFTRLTALTEVERRGKHRMWRCVCVCGKEKIVAMNALHMGRTRSCGCLATEERKSRAYLDGNYGSPTYSSWKSMVTRCHCETGSSYADYGAKGISVCDQWRYSFMQFLKDMGERPEGTSIDRKDNDKGYSPENCRWATRREQRMNQKRGTISIEQADQIRSLRAEHGWGPNTIAKYMGIKPGPVNGVIYLGNLAREL